MHARCGAHHRPRRATCCGCRRSSDWTDTDRRPTSSRAAAARAQSRALAHRVRTEADGAVTVAAEKGYLRETGNLVFHVALLVLLVGIALGGLFGYKGTVLVAEGSGFANVAVVVRRLLTVPAVPRHEAAAVLASPSTASPRPTRADGQPKSFGAHVTYRPNPDAPARPFDISPNHPLSMGGSDVYLVGHGYAPAHAGA